MLELKFDLSDIVLVPAEESSIESRKDCKIVKEDFSLPLMAAPMDTVVSKENYALYIKNGITPCIPRKLEIQTIDMDVYDHCFKAFGLCEIETQLSKYKKKISHKGLIWEPHTIEDDDKFYLYPNILIDIANGHMSKLIDIIKDIKAYWPNIKIMVGNIANPETFINLGLAGADYVRCSIGTGCFLPGQIVKLKNANKNIENVDIGDEVLTHSYEYKKIINKFEYDIDEEIYEINDIKCTQNHEFYVIEKEYEDIVNDENVEQYAKWISAKELDIKKHFLVKY